MKNFKKSIALLVAVSMIFGCIIGGTLAWLVDKTDEVKNTFTVGNIDITLTETTTDYKMVPGNTIAKDPEVTVTKGSEDCYLFVKVEKSSNLDDFITYAIDSGWQALEGVENVYYRGVSNNAENDQKFNVIGYMNAEEDRFVPNTVLVKDEVTKAQLDAITEEKATAPTLTFTAYASQLYKNNTETFTPIEAWNNANSSATLTP